MADVQNCILFATADWDTPYWTNKQHTAQQLAKNGFRVLYVESIGIRAPNLSSGRDVVRIWKRLLKALQGERAAEPNIWVLSPLVVPFKHHWPLVRAFNQSILRWSIGFFVRRHDFLQPMIWTYHPFMLNALPHVARAATVYHCVDDLSAIPGIDAVAFNCAEEKLLQRADIVFTTSQSLCDKCAKKNRNVHNFPNVADISHFSRAHNPEALPPEMAVMPEPRIGYIGVLSDFKVDFTLVLDVVKQRPYWQWVFIGEEREGQASPVIATLKTMSNTHFLGFRPYSQLPDYLRGFNVAVLPTLLNDYTRAMFPMKYYEYLAAGVPIAATPLDFTRTHKTGLEIGHDTASFIAAIERQLQRGRLSLAESETAVGDSTWERRMTKMLLLVRGLSLAARKG